MLSRPIFPYISFGSGLRYLLVADTNCPIHAEGHTISNIEKTLRMMDQLNLVVSKRAAPTRELIKIRDALKLRPTEANLTESEASEIKNAIKTLRVVIEAETSGSFAFIVTEKRIDVQKLLSDVKALMPDDVFDGLPSNLKYDFEQAGRCLAFELPTAAAFHILRGTEGVLRLVYRHQVKTKRMKVELWGPIVEALKKRRSPPPVELTNLLDHIRASFRNPTQHPDKIYGMDDAQNLFSLCVDAVSRMHDILHS